MAAPLRQAQRAYELTGATVVLKGAYTVIVGNDWMPARGLGDVLLRLAVQVRRLPRMLVAVRRHGRRQTVRIDRAGRCFGHKRRIITDDPRGSHGRAIAAGTACL